MRFGFRNIVRAFILLFFVAICVQPSLKAEEQQSLSQQIEWLQRDVDEQDKFQSIRQAGYSSGIPVPLPLPNVNSTSVSHVAPAARYDSSFDAGYDGGLFFRFYEEEDESFELKMNLRTQFRVSATEQSVDSWTDNAGITRDLLDRQNFDIERGRLIFTGHAFDPDLTFFLQMDGDTDRGHFVTFFDYFWSWHYDEDWELQFGKRKVSGGRNWLLGAFDSRLADRPFSTDFFRPGRTVGVWIVGEPSERSYIEIMAGAGYRTDNLSPAQTNDELATAASGYWDLWGDYGSNSPVDFECHVDPAVRLGYSAVFSSQGRSGFQLLDSDFVRLSDGTRITEVGALSPGARVEKFDITLLSVDAAFKHRGWSMNAEYFLQWLSDIKGDMPIPQDELFRHGYYIEGGYFVLPKKLDVNAHIAQVMGEFGDTFSYAAGFSIYPNETKNLKLIFDVTHIDGSPVNSSGSDIFVGDNGLLFRLQAHALF